MLIVILKMFTEKGIKIQVYSGANHFEVKCIVFS